MMAPTCLIAGWCDAGLLYPLWAITPSVNKTKLAAMAIATLASIDKLFIIP